MADFRVGSIRRCEQWSRTAIPLLGVLSPYSAFSQSTSRSRYQEPLTHAQYVRNHADPAFGAAHLRRVFAVACRLCSARRPPIDVELNQLTRADRPPRTRTRAVPSDQDPVLAVPSNQLGPIVEASGKPFNDAQPLERLEVPRTRTDSAMRRAHADRRTRRNSTSRRASTASESR